MEKYFLHALTATSVCVPVGCYSKQTKKFATIFDIGATRGKWSQRSLRTLNEATDMISILWTFHTNLTAKVKATCQKCTCRSASCMTYFHSKFKVDSVIKFFWFKRNTVIINRNKSTAQNIQCKGRKRKILTANSKYSVTAVHCNGR